MSFQADLSGKTALVTGGTGALGRRMAETLARAGARVAILARQPEKTAQTAALIAQTTGAQTLALVADVLEKKALEDTRAQLETTWGGLDILLNGAGGNHPQATATPQHTFFDLAQAGVEAVFALNYMGTLLPCQVFGAGMAERGAGVIINVSSMAALRPLTRVVAYGGAKAALSHFTQWLAVYLAQEYGSALRVNALAPGFFIGDQNRALLIDEKSGVLTPRGEAILAHTPMGRFGEPEDLDGALLWLASDAARFVTGIVVPIDGGFSAYSGV